MAMDGETIFGIIMMTACGFGIGAIFYGIGVWASKRTDPMHFWTGTTVDPKTISDVSAYNQENARMWKVYSVPFWLAGLLQILSAWIPQLAIAVAVLLVTSCTAGLVWLIWKYGRIKKKYRAIS